MRIAKGLLTALMICCLSACVSAQQGCKVLPENIQGLYEGECKNKLAHGRGTAFGIDTYTGSFRKGFPNGKGIYKWSTGEYYDGEWLRGKREGIGEYHYRINGKEAIQSGAWKADKYFGPEIHPPDIKLNQNISDVKFNRTGESDEVILKILMTGSNNTSITDFSINVSSGTEFRYGSYLVYKYVNFPFTCKLSYTTPNAFHTIKNHCILEFEISEAGRWEVKIINN